MQTTYLYNTLTFHLGTHSIQYSATPLPSHQHTTHTHTNILSFCANGTRARGLCQNFRIPHGVHVPRQMVRRAGECVSVCVCARARPGIHGATSICTRRPVDTRGFVAAPILHTGPHERPQQACCARCWWEVAVAPFRECLVIDSESSGKRISTYYPAFIEETCFQQHLVICNNVFIYLKQSAETRILIMIYLYFY